MREKFDICHHLLCLGEEWDHGDNNHKLMMEKFLGISVGKNVQQLSAAFVKLIILLKAWVLMGTWVLWRNDWIVNANFINRLAQLMNTGEWSIKRWHLVEGSGCGT